MRCAVAGEGGVLVVTEQSVCDEADFVLLTTAELHQATASPFKLTLAEGGLLSVAILSVWVSAWAVKAAARALSAGDPEQT
jgi:hypothetical protein